MSLTRSLTRPLTNRIARALSSPSAGGGGGGDQLLAAALALNPVWLYDHKDITSFFTDTAMTTPAAVGDPVAAVADRSINGRHRTQATLASRPILRQSGDLYYLEYDATDDFMQSAATVDLTDTDAVTACMGARKISDAASANLLAFGNAGVNPGSFEIRLPSNPGVPTFSVMSRGSVTAFAIYNNAAVAAPVTGVWTGVCRISTDSIIARRNGVQVATSSADQGTGNYDNRTMMFGQSSAATMRFNGYDYGGALYASALSGADLAAVEAFVADRTGVTL